MAARLTDDRPVVVFFLQDLNKLTGEKERLPQLEKFSAGYPGASSLGDISHRTQRYRRVPATSGAAAWIMFTEAMASPSLYVK